MSVGEGSRDEGISLCVKFKTSRMLSSAIFWWGCSSCCCSCCDRGKTKSTPSLDFGLEFDKKSIQVKGVIKMEVPNRWSHSCFSISVLLDLILE